MAEGAQHCRLHIKATPNASRSEVVGWVGAALKIRLKAPPVDGKANTELTRFLAKEFSLPKTSINIVAGVSSRQKQVILDGVADETVMARFPR